MPASSSRAAARFALATLCCTLACAAAVANADAAMHARGPAVGGRPATATLLWLTRTQRTHVQPSGTNAGAADPAHLDIAALAPALAALGVDVTLVQLPARAPTPASASPGLYRAFTLVRTGLEAGRRIAVGAEADTAGEALAIATAAPGIAAIVLFDASALTQRPAIAAQARSHSRAGSPTRVPLLQVFDARCEGMRNGPAPGTSADAFAAWLAARYGAVQLDALRHYGPARDARTQCMALRDARFVDDVYARAQRAGAGTAAPSWLALLEDERTVRHGTRAGTSTPHDVTGAPAQPHADLAHALLVRTLADHVAALIAHGDPNVRGRPAWPMFDPGARRYLHLGATVRAARDPLVEALDLQAALDARAPTASAPARANAPSSRTPSP